MIKQTDLISFVAWRVILLLTVILAAKFFEFRSFLHYVGLENILHGETSWLSGILPWANFDGIHYLQIAGDGYTDQARFLPLFPSFLSLIFIFLKLITNFDVPALSTWSVLIALISSFGFFLLSIKVFQKLLKLDFSTQQTRNAVLILVLFPASFFFVSVYTESLFLLLALSAFLFARQKNWTMAWLMTGLLCITRLPGILIFPALIWEAKEQGILKSSWKKILPWLTKLSLALTPLIAYAYFNYIRWHDALFFVHAHGALANSRSVTAAVFPGITMVRYLRIFLTMNTGQYEYWLAWLEMIAFVGGGYLLYLAYKLKVRMSYLIFGVLLWLLPSLSGTFSGMPRYLLLIIPIYIVLAKIVDQKYLKYFLAISFGLQIVLLTLFARGYLIG